MEVVDTFICLQEYHIAEQIENKEERKDVLRKLNKGVGNDGEHK